MAANSSARKAAFAAASVALGLWAFKTINAVSGPAFEPILAVCGDASISAAEFPDKTGYHAYDARMGLGAFRVLVCLITQFLQELRGAHPAGMIAWVGLMIVGMPLAVFSTLEGGRAGARGPIRYPIVLGLLYQLLGISVVFPLVWVPAFVYGAGTGPASVRRARLSIPLCLPGILLTAVVFTADPAGATWTSCAGALGGPMLAVFPAVLWGDAPPARDASVSSRKVRAEAGASAYRATIPFSLAGYYALVKAAHSAYGTDLSALWAAVWTDASASVAFMTVDALVLYGAVCWYIAYRSEMGAAKAIALTPFLGPGAACSLVLADMELQQAALDSKSEKKA